ncbi:MAG: WD40 repeat domain-containing protein [Planctomycetaceae bacterium]
MADQNRKVAQAADAGPITAGPMPSLSKNVGAWSWKFFVVAGLILLAVDAAAWWMLRTSKFIPLVGHQHGVNDVEFSPDGNLAASASDDTTIRFWNRSGTPITTVTGHTDRVTAMVFAPSGRELISATGKGEIRIWDVATGIEINAFKAHEDCIHGLAMNSSGTELYAVSWDSTLSVWDPQNGKLLHRKSCPKVAECCALARDDSVFLVGCVDGVIRVWNVSDDTLNDVYAEHTDQVKALRFSSDGTLVLSCGRDHRLAVWKFPSGEAVSSIRCGTPLRDAVFFDGETKILAGAEDGNLLLFDRKSQRWLYRIQSAASQLLTVAVSPDDFFACGGYGEPSTAMLFSKSTISP